MKRRQWHAEITGNGDTEVINCMIMSITSKKNEIFFSKTEGL